MKDPIDRLRNLFEMNQAKDDLEQSANREDLNRLDRDFRNFVSNVVFPAYEKIRCEVFRDKYRALSEIEFCPGFKVHDRGGSTFWFWIEICGRMPTIKARRQFGDSPILLVVSTPCLRKSGVDINEVVEQDVINAILFAYEKSC